MSTSRAARIRRLAGAALACALASRVEAQKPPTRTIVPIAGYTSTPERVPFDTAEMPVLRVPAGFQVTVFAQGLGAPRMMAVGTDGTVYVTRRDSNDVIALRDDGSGKAGEPRKVVSNLRRVHGIAVEGRTMFLATVKEVYVADMREDGSVGEPRAIITDLPDGGQHPNRTIAMGPDGMLYISIGSTCNVCDEPNAEHATILRAKPDGSERGVHARGLRNTIGFGWHPTTGEMWGMDHGSDWMGNDAPPEELNRIQNAGHYGWPFCHGAREVSRYFTGEPAGSRKEELCPRTVAPVLTYQAHSAPLQMAFYTGAQFPEAYRGDAFVAMRGSWNRQPPTGYKVVRIRFENGEPRRVEDFLTGFLSRDATKYYARVAGVVVASDGSLLVADDTNGVIYRVSYASETNSGER